MAGKYGMQQSTKAIEMLQSITYNSNPLNFPEKRYIFEPYNDTSLTDEEFHGRILENLQKGVALANITIVLSKNFKDAFTGEIGVINVKVQKTRPTIKPNSLEYLSSLIVKEPIEMQSYQKFNVANRVYWISEEYPETYAFGDENGEEGQISYTPMYLLYSYTNIKNLKGKFTHSLLTGLRYGSNIARNTEGNYLTVKFFLLPVQPINARYIELKFNYGVVALSTGGPIEVLDSDNNSSSIELVEYDKDDWDLAHLSFVVNGSTVTTRDTVAAEYLYRGKYAEDFDSSNHSGRGDVDDNWEQSLAVADKDKFLETGYTQWYQSSFSGIGLGEFTDEFVKIQTAGLIGGPSGLYSQFGGDFLYSHDGTEVRSLINWKNSNRWFVHDIWQNEHFLVANYKTMTVAHNFILNDENAKTNNPVDKDTFFKSIFTRNASIGGGDMSNSKFPDKLSVSTFVSDIENTDTSTGWAMMSCGSNMENRNNMYLNINWVSKNITVSNYSVGDAPLLNLPDYNASLASGVTINDNYLNGTTLLLDKEVRILLDLGSEKIINQFSINMRGNDFIMQYLDENKNPALGAFGTENEQIVLSPTLVKSPQYNGAVYSTKSIVYI